MPDTLEYKLDSDTLKRHCNFARNQYKAFLQKMNSHIDATRKDNPNYNELTDVVNKCFKLFTGVAIGVRNTFGTDAITELVKEKDNLLTTYALHIASRTISKDLEGSIRGNYSNSLMQDAAKLPKDEIFNWDKTDYTNAKKAFEALVTYIESSSKKPTEAAKEFFDAYSNITNHRMISKLESGVYDNLQKVEWKIGSYKIDGLTEIVAQKNGQSNVPITERENQQFHTPLKFMSIDKNKILPKEKIVGDHTVIDLVENMIDYLFFFNAKIGSNPYLDKGVLKNSVCLEGAPGGGKGSVGYYLVDYALRMGDALNKEVFITKFEIDSSWKDGNILKLKDQFRQICEEDRLFIIFQDEITQILKGEENALSGESREAVVLEFQKFMDGEYQNRGNYLFLATTNKYQTLPAAIRSRFNPPLGWDGAQTADEKGRLFKYKLEDGIKNGYVVISDSEFDRLGKIAFENNLDGRVITNTCTLVNDLSIMHDKKSVVWEARADYNKQLELIDTFRHKITYQIVETILINNINNIEGGKEHTFQYAKS